MKREAHERIVASIDAELSRLMRDNGSVPSGYTTAGINPTTCEHWRNYTTQIPEASDRVYDRPPPVVPDEPLYVGDEPAREEEF